ncbi:TPA: AAA family ATPase [Legionella pneumophila]|nr:AAA family ATPase [Legionella pneumophila]HBI2979452.1 AAA family ATPase [Legionella pneumophila]
MQDKNDNMNLHASKLSSTFSRSMEEERLLSLIEFAQQSARLKLNPVKDAVKHGLFNRFEHELLSSPGVHINIGEDDDELWLRVERLVETHPPEPQDPQLIPWLDLSRKTEIAPVLKSAIDISKIDIVNVVKNEETDNVQEQPKLMLLSEYEHRETIERLFQDYVHNQWNSWAEEEKKRRCTIKLYSELFTLKQQLEGSIVDTQIELVWGIGLGIWKTNEFNIRYPLITQSVEVSLNPKDMAIEIRPRRSAEPLFELDVYMSIDSLGVADVQKAYNDLMSKQTQDFSPFERFSYEPQLQLAATHLDSKGVYWPTQITNEDRQIPDSGENLKVTDTWILFARPRSKSLYIQDLENFKKHFNAEKAGEISSVIKEMVKEPVGEHREIKLTNFRGLSNLGYTSNDSSKETASELFFPLPFNEEQVKIVQKLEHSNGVVVQGPPGTGKTHTIANIIAHYMANGKRVLVTSMKEPALSVLKEKLPVTIQPLAISLLTNEQDGMKQFEFAISKIAQELQTIDRTALGCEIENDEQFIDKLHAKLAWIDRSITNWAKSNIQPIYMDGQEIHPEDAAKEIAAANGEFDWLEDPISIVDEHKPKFDNTDIIQLREARRNLQGDLDYLGKSLPALEDIPKLNSILNLHRELLKNKTLKDQVLSVDVFQIPDLAENSTQVETILNEFYEYRTTKKQLETANLPWFGSLQSCLKNPDSTPVIQLIEKIADEVNKLQAEKNVFLENPVVIPTDLDLTDEITQAIANKSEGKHPFGVSGILTKRALIKKIESILILNKPAKNQDEWLHIYRYVLLCNRIDELVLRWNKIATEMSIFSLINSEMVNSLQHARAELDFYFAVKKYIGLEVEIKKRADSILPSWPCLNELFEVDVHIHELIELLERNLNFYHSSKAWSDREAILNSLSIFNGRISESIKIFFSETVGNPSISDMEIQTQSTQLIEELRRIHGLKPALDDVYSICDLIHQSGATQWAQKLKETPLESTVDSLLPDDWSQAWRLRRLANYFYSMSHFDEFKKLTTQRYEYEKQLAKTYQDVVAKRTWLQLAKNATPDIRAALQAFQSAISRIGKGTGKRAIRYRRDAKNAAALTNKAIPCWIMPHYRISESLPPEFGCFDLVIIDEASQSDLSALPAMLRANKLLVVGDDKQVSPDGVGLEEEKINNLMAQYLANQVAIYRQAMSPERSIYDLCKVVFADSQIMLREHFRCVTPIIEYSKREFYNHELKPLRLPTKSERLDPPLIDVIIEDGFRINKENNAEAKFIVEEINNICNDPAMANRTIGVVSLLGNEQARKIWEMIQQDITPDKITNHKITCGDALTFQGKERDIIFLSMVATPDNVKADSREASAQRFNVAASRARDRMYLVRSVELDHLSHKDSLRRGLIEHFSSPFAQDEIKVKNLRELCESGFELEIYDLLTERGYRVIPQVKVGNYRLDMVVEGHDDARLAIECDGDHYHDASKWEDDMNRQRILERAGWKFWRCFASTFVMNKKHIIQDLIGSLSEHGIEPIGRNGELHSIHCEQRRITVLTPIEAVIEE